jgi:hypothetical protein
VSEFDKLLRAAKELLAARYTDGECDAVALSRFAAVVGEVNTPRPCDCLDPMCRHAGHKLIVEEKQPEFLPRRGCLDCNVWLDPVRLA